MSKKLHLNPQLFKEGKVKKESIRVGFGEGLLLAGQNNKDVVALCSDLTDSTKMSMFKEAFPNRFIETGIAEQSMASVASGMAAMGKIPVISSYAMFSPGRNWEQIRTTICYNDSPVIIAGSHAGVSVGPDGATHQAIEDIALMRVLPRMQVLVPCDSLEAKKAVIAAIASGKPTYIRLAREATPLITSNDTNFKIGESEIYFRPDGDADVGLIASGALLYNAIMAAKELENEGIRVSVLNLASVKPMDTDAVLSLAKRTGKIVTVEEHQKAGGVGSAVAEFLAQNYPVPMRFVGVNDVFGQSGTPEELIVHYGMDIEGIKRIIRDIKG